MAQKRMFAQKVVESDSFLLLPPSAQALYFHINMNADDDGFCNNAGVLARIIGATQDDLTALIDGRFLLAFSNSNVVLVKHFLIHNSIRADRKKATAYTDEKKAVYVKENGAYTEQKGKMTDKTTQNDRQNDPKCRHSIDKIRLDKISLDKNSLVNEYTRAAFTPPRLEEIKDEIKIKNYSVDADHFYDYYTANGWKVGQNNMKNWKAALANWNRRGGTTRAAQSYDTEKYKQKAKKPIEYKRREQA